jgi:hypothetical protein
VVVEIDLGVVCLVNVEGHGFAFVVSLSSPHYLLIPPHYFACMGIVFSSWLLLVSDLGHRLQVIISWRVLFVHLRSVNSHAYFVCSFEPAMTLMLNPVWNGGKSILWYWRMR